MSNPILTQKIKPLPGWQGLAALLVHMLFSALQHVSALQHLLLYFSLLCNIWIQHCCSLSPSAALLKTAAVCLCSAALLVCIALALPCLMQLLSMHCSALGSPPPPPPMSMYSVQSPPPPMSMPRRCCRRRASQALSTLSCL